MSSLPFTVHQKALALMPEPDGVAIDYAAKRTRSM
jgi:hypothetical protein